LLDTAKIDKRRIGSELTTKLHQIGLRNFIDVHVHYNFSAILVDALDQFPDQAHIFSSVANRQAVGVFVGNNNCLGTAHRRRYRLSYKLLGFFRVTIRQEERAQNQLLILWATRLIRDENCSPAQFLKEQTLLEKNVVKSLRRSYLLEVDIDGTRLDKRLPIENNIKVELLREAAN